ncbi:divergent PAP2 family protein [Paenibacillus agilis]|uniref:Divergent PAP2 family protein n=1 Tax=Paenibacillus agilis TaxID=3020863 RepID=A0A559IP78_9BACL|nr:divergent PAP2 family protein [Paenibacillus agilis]TVX89406.1 divergent PAP2 family protein [Paenibacillus agilis]
MPYFLAPFIAWFVSGVLKYLINYVRFKNEAKNLIGNGGFPSTHTTVITTPTILVGLNEGFFSPIFGLAVAITYIVIIDATGLRIFVGQHAKVLNQLEYKDKKEKLRERMGHTKVEVLGGLVLGVILGYILNIIFQSFS